MVYHIVWFVDIEAFLCPWDESHLIMVYESFNVLLNSVFNILLRIFVPVIFSVCVLSLVLVLG